MYLADVLLILTFLFLHTYSHFICHILALSEVLEKCRSLFSKNIGKPSQSWSSRVASENENWDSKRGTLFRNVVKHFDENPGVCQICHVNAAVICCTDCSPVACCCSDCDETFHSNQPLHDRLASTNGFLQPVAPYVTIKENQFKEIHMNQLLHIPGICYFFTKLFYKPLCD